MPATKKTVKDNPFVAKKIRNLPDNFLDCRDPGLRHSWDRLNDFHVIEMATAISGRRIQALGRESQCNRCHTVKKERFVVTRVGMEKVGQSYDYPEGYLMPGIPRGVTPSTIIYQENYRRTMERIAKAQPGERATAEA